MLKLLLLFMTVARTYSHIFVLHRHTSYETVALRFGGFRTLFVKRLLEFSFESCLNKLSQRKIGGLLRYENKQ